MATTDSGRANPAATLTIDRRERAFLCDCAEHEANELEAFESAMQSRDREKASELLELGCRLFHLMESLGWGEADRDEYLIEIEDTDRFRDWLGRTRDDLEEAVDYERRSLFLEGTISTHGDCLAEMRAEVFIARGLIDRLSGDSGTADPIATREHAEQLARKAQHLASQLPKGTLRRVLLEEAVADLALVGIRIPDEEA